MEGIIERANKVLDTAAGAKLSSSILRKCKGVAIITYSEIGFVYSYGTGDGVVVKHNDDGSWSAPVAIAFGGGSLGAVFGKADKQILIFPMSESALHELSGESVKLGGQLAIAAGPFGRELEAGYNLGTTEDYGRGTWSYVFEKGLYFSVSLTGTQIDSKKGDNKEFYGVSVPPRDILEKPGAVTIPTGKGVEELHEKLAKLT